MIRQNIIATILLAFVITGCSGLKLVNTRAEPDALNASGRIAEMMDRAEIEVELPLVENWVYNAGGGFGPASPMIVGDYLITGTRRGDVHAVELESGKKKGIDNYGTAVDGSPLLVGSSLIVPVSWGSKKGLVSHNLAKGNTNWTKKTPPVETAILQFGGVLYLVDHTSTVRALVVETGDELWSHELDASIAVKASPLELTDETIGVVDVKGLLYSISKEDGTVEWTRDLGYPVHSDPETDGTRSYFSTTRGQLIAVNNDTGRVAWNYSLGSETVRVVTAAPFGENLVVGASSGKVVVISRVSGTLIWQTSTIEAVAAKPLVTKDYIFVSTMDRMIYGLDRSTGVMVWETELKGRAKSAMVAQNNKIFALSEPRLIYNFVSDLGGVASAE